MTTAAPAQTAGTVETARRIVASLQLAAQEYRLAWQGARLVNPAEWMEARLFVGEARRSAAELPPPLAAELVPAIEGLEQGLAERMPADSLAAAAAAVEQRLARALGTSLDERPARNPSLANGERVYRARCGSCHGEAGGGNGPLAAGLQPPPSDLTDGALLATATPLDFYLRVTHGVPGTAMPAFEGTLSREERWDAVAYAFALTDSLSRRSGSGRLAVVFATVRGTLGRALELAAAGDPEGAARRALDAYMAFEAVEASLGATNPSLVARAEERFASFRVAAGGRDSSLVAAAHSSLLASLDEAQVALASSRSPAGLLAESLLLMLREGFEAILVIAAIMAVLAKAGAHSRRRIVRWGIVAALLASLLTAAAIEWLFHVSLAQREALEGAVMLVAAATLFYVSYWLISKVELAAWTRFVKQHVQRAVERGSALALAGVAFLAVYREGFETVLFYKALFVTAGAGGAAPIVAGMTIAVVALVALYIGIERFGLRVPMRPFFAVTGTMLGYLAFVFSGKGVRELQEGGYIGITPLAGAPSSGFLGVYPTVETLTVQAVILLALAIGLVWTFLIRPRRIAAAEAVASEAEA